jgi:phage terminase large subunit
MFLFGSRKSAKTKSIALRLVIRLMMDKDYNAVAMRKIASELKDSVVAELQ